MLYVIMNYVVIPLSAAQSGSNDRLWIAMTVFVHVVFIGIPIAFANRRALHSST